MDFINRLHKTLSGFSERDFSLFPLQEKSLKDYSLELGVFGKGFFTFPCPRDSTLSSYPNGWDFDEGIDLETGFLSRKLRIETKLLKKPGFSDPAEIVQPI